MLAEFLEKLLAVVKNPVEPVPGRPGVVVIRGEGDKWLLSEPEDKLVLPHEKIHVECADLETYAAVFPGVPGFKTFLRQNGNEFRMEAVQRERPPAPRTGPITERTKTMSLRQSPDLKAWFGFLGDAVSGTERRHRDMADFLLDHQEDIVEAMAAKQLAVFKTARKVTVDADADTGASQGVKVEFSAGTGTAALAIPRSFTVEVAPFANAVSVSVKFVVLVRMNPPPANAAADAQPTFALRLSDPGKLEVDLLNAALGAARFALGDEPVLAGRLIHEEWQRF